MPVTDIPLVLLRSPAGERRVRLGDYLTPPASDRAKAVANHWIKSLRHAQVEHRSFRDRFTYRGDSLWWFAEIYLHKTRLVESIVETLESTAELIRTERPDSVSVIAGDNVTRLIVPDVARRLGVRSPGGDGTQERTRHRAHAAARQRARPYDRRHPGQASPSVAARS